MDTTDNKKIDSKSLTVPEKETEIVTTSKYEFPKQYYRNKCREN